VSFDAAADVSQAVRAGPFVCSWMRRDRDGVENYGTAFVIASNAWRSTAAGGTSAWDYDKRGRRHSADGRLQQIPANVDSPGFLDGRGAAAFTPSHRTPPIDGSTGNNSNARPSYVAAPPEGKRGGTGDDLRA